MDIPLTTLRARLKCHRPGALSAEGNALFDFLFPGFVHLDRFHSSDLRLIVGGDNVGLTGRGRERRYAGDRTLDRGRYYALQNPDSEAARLNPLICELFAYTMPENAVQPMVLDATVEEDFEQLERAGLAPTGPCLVFIFRDEDIAKLPPELGIGPDDRVIGTPLDIFDAEVPDVIDLRLPAAQDWFFDTFYRLELDHRVVDGPSLLVRSGETTLALPFEDRPLHSFWDMLPTLVAPAIGGGLPFLQGIGAWLRSHGVSGLVFPSARTDFGAELWGGELGATWGWNFVSYHDSPPAPWRDHFGKCQTWLDWTPPARLIFEVEHPVENRSWMVTGIRDAELARFRRSVEAARMMRGS